MPGLAARRPAGTATGAVDGWYPNDLALGAPPVMGFSRWDDFTLPHGVSTFGDLSWTLYDMGTPPAVSVGTETALTEIGIARITTGAVTGEGGTGAYAHAHFAGAPPVGIWYTAKLRAIDTTDIEVWSGWVEDPTARVYTGISNGFVGFRGVQNGVLTNWYGVCRSGAAETTVNLGVACNTTWRILGLRRTTTGFNFYVYDHADRNFFYGDTQSALIGTISTNIPTASLTMAPLGVCPRTNVAKAAEIDFCSFGGLIAR
jgi:hypothetical protein